MVGCSYPNSVTSANIQSGFRVPFNGSVLMMHFSVQEQTSEMEVNDGEQPGTSGEPPSISGVPITPEHIKPFKKA